MPTFGSPGVPSLNEAFFRNSSRSRLQALYSDFSRQKQSNPTSYHANIEWWRRTLVALVDSGTQGDIDLYSGNRLVLQADRGLLERLKLEKIGKPLALSAVVNELHSSKTLMSLPVFMSARASIYDPGWLPYRIASFMVGKPLWWALEQIGIVGDEGLLSSSSQQVDWFGEYVCVELLEQAADAVTALQETKMVGPADALYTREAFRRSFASIFNSANHPLLSETDTRVLLKYLERERNVLVVDNEVVKFVHPTDRPDEGVITAVDRGILELKTAISNMRHLVEVIQGKMDECTRKATTALQHKQKPQALSYLRSRKQLEEVLSERLSSLGTLEGTMVSIETAAGNAQIMKSYEVSTSTLRSILSHPSLQRTNIDKTMDALAEANYAAQEVDNTLRIGGDVALGVDFDEGVIEDEWKALVQDIEERGPSRTLEQLQTPVVPPSSTKASEPTKKLIPSH